MDHLPPLARYEAQLRQHVSSGNATYIFPSPLPFLSLPFIYPHTRAKRTKANTNAKTHLKARTKDKEAFDTRNTIQPNGSETKNSQRTRSHTPTRATDVKKHTTGNF